MAAGALLSAGSALAAALPLYEGFEGYASGSPLNTLSNQGWGASAATVVIQTVTNVPDPVLGTNALAIPQGQAASNTVTAEALSNVWVDVTLDQAMGMNPELVGAEAVDPTATALVFLNTNGCPVVWDPAGAVWVAYTQDYRQVSAAVFNTSRWVRVTLCQNYSNKTSALFMNGRLMASGLPFVDTNRTAYGQFEANGGASVTSYLDELALSYTPPAAMADLDDDGMSEADELQAYGSTTNRHRPVITVMTPVNGAVTPGGAFDVLPGATTNFVLAASNGYYVATVRTNGQSVGSFSGQYTNSAAYTWANISPDGLSDGTFEAVFLPNPQVVVAPTTNGSVSPSAVAVYPFMPADFALTASNGYYVADVLTNNSLVGPFAGRYTASGAFTWPSVDPAGGTLGAVFRRKPQLTPVASPVGGPSLTGGTIGLSASEVFPGGQVTCTLTSASGYLVSSVLTNGAVAATFGGGVHTASATLSNIWGDLTVTALFTYSGYLAVPHDYATIQAAVDAAVAGTVIGVSGGTYAGDVTVDKAVTLVGTNVTVVGALNLAGGGTGTLAGCQGLVVSGVTTVASGALLVVTNGSVDVGSLVIEAGGTVQVFNATAFVADGATLTGTFTLDSGWGTVVVPQVPPYEDSFERYADGTRMSRMGYFGWSASTTNIIVQSAVAESLRAVAVEPRARLASAMAPVAASNLWVEVYYRDTNRIPSGLISADEADTNQAVELFINTDGYVTVFNPALAAWDVCSNDVLGVVVPALAAGDWPRITVNANYARGEAAVFLNGRLLRMRLRFINTNLVTSGQFEVTAGYAGATYVDTYSVRTNWAGIVGDTDGDQIPDALEIDRYNDLNARPLGAVFRFR